MAAAKSRRVVVAVVSSRVSDCDQYMRHDSMLYLLTYLLTIELMVACHTEDGSQQMN